MRRKQVFSCHGLRFTVYGFSSVRVLLLLAGLRLLRAPLRWGRGGVAVRYWFEFEFDAADEARRDVVDERPECAEDEAEDAVEDRDADHYEQPDDDAARARRARVAPPSGQYRRAEDDDYQPVDDAEDQAEGRRDHCRDFCVGEYAHAPDLHFRHRSLLHPLG